MVPRFPQNAGMPEMQETAAPGRPVVPNSSSLLSGSVLPSGWGTMRIRTFWAVRAHNRHETRCLSGTEEGADPYVLKLVLASAGIWQGIRAPPVGTRSRHLSEKGSEAWPSPACGKSSGCGLTGSSRPSDPVTRQVPVSPGMQGSTSTFPGPRQVGKGRFFPRGNFLSAEEPGELCPPQENPAAGMLQFGGLSTTSYPLHTRDFCLESVLRGGQGSWWVLRLER